MSVSYTHLDVYKRQLEAPFLYCYPNGKGDSYSAHKKKPL